MFNVPKHIKYYMITNEVVPSSSLVDIEVEVVVGVEVGVEVEAGIGRAGVGSLRWVVEDEVEAKHMSK